MDVFLREKLPYAYSMISETEYFHQLVFQDLSFKLVDTVPDAALDFLVYNPRFISNRQISEIIQNTTARPINLDVYCGDEIVLSRRHPNAIWTGTGNAEIFRPVDRDCLVAKYRKVRSRKKKLVTFARNKVVQNIKYKKKQRP